MPTTYYTVREIKNLLAERYHTIPENIEIANPYGTLLISNLYDNIELDVKDDTFIFSITE